ncbi:hypothetical protein BDP81DRAFT_440435 [Colletotrichum phormii]|uniref:Uncharacterized protein n=1 Tax=Colletotrichum phormii TaxID=359342 RepID=A0AAI9ZEQ8_9PEZI|nr:uncharacterized protein BDP81DRAFT_440435 [Colletotrichum phormii]KAK1622888.1 hypothetical protein BDP81DRAFT_440435 [Colletotrichum phormii]
MDEMPLPSPTSDIEAQYDSRIRLSCQNSRKSTASLSTLTEQGTQLQSPPQHDHDSADESTNSNQPSTLDVDSHCSKKYKPVATEEDGPNHIEFKKRGIEAFTIITDSASITLPLALAVFVMVLWHLDGREANMGTYIHWENAKLPKFTRHYCALE